MKKDLESFSSKLSEQIIRDAAETVDAELHTVEAIRRSLDESFARTVYEIYRCKGRIILTGIGKSAVIAQKITATFNSTGTPAVFMHAADAIHGDLGLILEDDLVFCLSKSGNTPEIKVLMPLIKQFGNRIVALTADKDSYLGQAADHVLLTRVEREACPNNLAPTSSTTAQLVMGDAVAVSLLKLRGFSESDFARYHPGGALGKKLYLRVSDLYILNEKPKVSPETPLKQVIMEISSKRLGAAAVISSEETIQGIITDGDLRRMLEKGLWSDNAKAADIMSFNPKTVEPDTTAVDAYMLMKNNNITQLLVRADGGKYLGIIHLHDILKEGIV